MVIARYRRNLAGRMVFLAAVTLAGAGAGVAAALAVSDSGLVRAAGAGVGGAAGLIAAGWADLARGRKEVKAAAVRGRERVLDAIVTTASRGERDESVLDVLVATREDAAPFRGRAADLVWLERWCADPGGHPVAVVAGPGGVGKTRLVTQFASLLPQPWVAGWLRSGCGGSAIEAVRGCGDPALILVDDANSRPDLPALLDDLAGHGAGSGSPVGVVLIVRTVESLGPAAEQLREGHRWVLAAESVPMRRSVSLFGTQ